MTSTMAPTTVEPWQSMAELMAVRGLGPQCAEALVRAGIDSIASLRKATPSTRSKAIEAVEKGRGQRIQGIHVTPKVAQRWIEAAREHPERPVPREAHVRAARQR